MRYPGLVAAVTSVLVMGLASIASAQQPPVQPPGAQPKAAPKAATKSTPTPGPDATAAKPPGDNPLRARVEQLEEQLVDLQVTIGTLESLARTSGPSAAATPRAAAPSYASGGDSSGVAARVDGLEIQLRALVSQVEQLNDQVRLLNNRRAAASPPPLAAAEPRLGPSPGFGATTVRPGGGDQIGQVLGDDLARPQPAAVPGGSDAGNPKQLYETAYAHLLQQNYGAAEVAFEDFLARHPSDQLAGNAQYWLGESHFVRGQYKQAAGAFLKGYQSYARSAKAPDSLMKLAMSLDRLGQRDAACSSFGELNTRFPNAPQNVRTRVDSERRRIGCL